MKLQVATVLLLAVLAIGEAARPISIKTDGATQNKESSAKALLGPNPTTSSEASLTDTTGAATITTNNTTSADQAQLKALQPESKPVAAADNVATSSAADDATKPAEQLAATTKLASQPSHERGGHGGHSHGGHGGHGFGHGGHGFGHGGGYHNYGHGSHGGHGGYKSYFDWFGWRKLLEVDSADASDKSDSLNHGGGHGGHGFGGYGGGNGGRFGPDSYTYSPSDNWPWQRKLMSDNAQESDNHNGGGHGGHGGHGFGGYGGGNGGRFGPGSYMYSPSDGWPWSRKLMTSNAQYAMSRGGSGGGGHGGHGGSYGPGYWGRKLMSSDDDGAAANENSSHGPHSGIHALSSKKNTESAQYGPDHYYYWQPNRQLLATQTAAAAAATDNTESAQYGPDHYYYWQPNRQLLADNAVSEADSANRGGFGSGGHYGPSYWGRKLQSSTDAQSANDGGHSGPDSWSFRGLKSEIRAAQQEAANRHGCGSGGHYGA